MNEPLDMPGLVNVGTSVKSIPSRYPKPLLASIDTNTNSLNDDLEVKKLAEIDISYFIEMLKKGGD